MSYLPIPDTPKPKYIVVTVSTEYEQSAALFITLEAAQAFAKTQVDSEVYLGELKEF